jgi:hypothetical protein
MSNLCKADKRAGLNLSQKGQCDDVVFIVQDHLTDLTFANNFNKL